MSHTKKKKKTENCKQKKIFFIETKGARTLNTRKINIQLIFFSIQANNNNK